MLVPRFVSPTTGIDKGFHYTQGYVQIHYNGEWGSICDDKFEDNNHGANVVCKMMGYTSGTYSASYKQIPVATAIKPKMLLDNVICKGSEKSIDECAHTGWGVNDCRSHSNPYDEDVGVRCYGTGKFYCIQNINMQPKWL